MLRCLSCIGSVADWSRLNPSGVSHSSHDPLLSHSSRVLKMGLYLCSVPLISLPDFMIIPYCLEIIVVFNVLKSWSVVL